MKRLCRSIIGYRIFWELPILLVAGAGSFIWFFWKPLWMEMDQDAVRNLILLIAGIVGWYFLSRRTKAAEQDAKTAQQNAKTTEQGLTVERLTHAIEQLANKNSSIRLGGILGLEQIADTHGEERKKIARILVSFIHTRAIKDHESTEKNITTSKVPEPETEEEFSAYRAQRLDIEAAVNALASIASKLEQQNQFQEQYNEKKQHLCDLQDLDLRGLRFVRADLSSFEFAGADMRGAWLSHANLTGSNFCKYDYNAKGFITKFAEALLDNANLSDSCLIGVDFSDLQITQVDFSNSQLAHVNFDNSQLTQVNFSNSDLENTNFSGSQLIQIDFSNSRVVNAEFSDAYLDETIFDETDISGTNFEQCEGLIQEQIDKAYYAAFPPQLPDDLKRPENRGLPFFED